jgi:hypothetical protein
MFTGLFTFYNTPVKGNKALIFGKAPFFYQNDPVYGRVFKPVTGFPEFDGMVPAAHFQKQLASTAQGQERVAQESKVVLWVVKIPAGGKEIPDRIERIGPDKGPHIVLNEFDFQTFRSGAFASVFEEKRHQIHGGYLESLAGEFQGVTSRTAEGCPKLLHFESFGVEQSPVPRRTWLFPSLAGEK